MMRFLTPTSSTQENGSPGFEKKEEQCGYVQNTMIYLKCGCTCVEFNNGKSSQYVMNLKILYESMILSIFNRRIWTLYSIVDENPGVYLVRNLREARKNDHIF